MRKFISIATILFATPVLADATLTCALTGAGTANMSVPLVISDADGARILAVAVKAYSPITVPPVIAANDPRCATTPPDAGCLPTFRQATNREAITGVLHDMLYSTLLSNVKESEKAAAAKTATDAVNIIVPK